ncbi:DUF1045 domain-containing protein [Bradyrhizobium sp. GCM10028915]|uniref:DUF1045 domain-containing protein n=1 Tax=Bradyrhizobium sp. GCM10028915 TaxID=3273385 RepID=UPI00361B5D2F
MNCRIWPHTSVAIIQTIQPFAGLALCIVEEFDASSPAESARLSTALVQSAQRAHLVRWGYSYVFDLFRFHMTLTGRVLADTQPKVRQELDAVFAPLFLDE